MDFHYCDKLHTAYLVDDGTMDTVIKVDGVEIRYDGDYAASFRDANGHLPDEGLRQLAQQALDDGLVNR